MAHRTKRQRLSTSNNGSDGLDGNDVDSSIAKKSLDLKAQIPNNPIGTLERPEMEELDQFDSRFIVAEGQGMGQSIKHASQDIWHSFKAKSSELGRILTMLPGTNLHELRSNLHPVSGPAGLKLKKRLQEPISKLSPNFSGLESEIAAILFNYRDLLFCDRTVRNGESLRRLYCLHALNHVFKTRDRILKNNERLSREPENALEFRDQGFTRPKVLMLLPTRQACYRTVSSLLSLCDFEQKENNKRFQDSFFSSDDSISSTKPEDFRETFDGNNDDSFKLGIKFTRKTVKFFAPFYASDVIIASPLGLKIAIGGEGAKKQDYDFLSAIELLIIDQADALTMQNFSHMSYIFKHLNLEPRESHDCDFSRVRNFYLDGQAKYMRQTLIFSAFNTIELNNLFSANMKNAGGKSKATKESDGVIGFLALPIKQTFSKFGSLTPENDPDARFDYFTSTIVPHLIKQEKSGLDDTGGVLIFIPSYSDFLRVKNYFDSSSEVQDIPVGSISEYSSLREVSQARSHFLSGRYSVLLYSERAHHFRRYSIKGAKRVVMYGLPENPNFYREIAGEFLEASINNKLVRCEDASVRSLFSKWDAMKLERIAGSERIRTMLKHSVGDTFEFV